MKRFSTRLIAASVVFAALVALPGRVSVGAEPTQDALFNDEGDLQEVRIVISQRSWQTLQDNFQENTYYAADFTFAGTTVRNVGIRSRGNTTRNPAKPGLRVDFNHYLSNQEFLGLKALALDNAYSDASLMREAITMKMFVKVGLPAPRETHVRLYVNNEFIGVYVIIESMDRPFISRMFGVAEADIERGGYLYEYNWLRPYGFEDLGAALEPYAELFTAKTRETDSMSALYAPIRDMIRAINDTPDDRFVGVVGQYLDVPEAMKYLAIENFLAEDDGLVGEWGLHNFYLYRFRASRPAVFVPWDKDQTFSAADHPISYHLDANEFTSRAMAIPELRDLYYNTLLQCAALAAEPAPEDTRGWLEREVERVNARIESSVAEDRNADFSFEQYQSEIDFMREFARTRSPFVRCEVASATGADVEQGCPALNTAALRR